MDGFGSGQRPHAADRRTEIVSGKGYGVGASQIYATRSSSSDLPPPPPPTEAPRASNASAKPWGLSDAEMRRKKRIARYKAYTVEGKVKASLRKGLRWIKDKCSQIVHGY
ncbi:PREDICTED: uncharacterized protein LOC104817471 [Tarenaya hassleriana]|uniref:uncharacterized protein LOC104817471 n=1 Tax=Tarenaya hassleriana TaxID=28532 RepID=UPI00053C8A55|nr:PREDICTED: uncharacterized protein LOC104817471 [Tarenaya hassleriana]